MDNLEKNKEKTAEDVFIADEDLELVAGGEENYLKTPCPKCGMNYLIKNSLYIYCANRKGCGFVTHAS